MNAATRLKELREFEQKHYRKIGSAMLAFGSAVFFLRGWSIEIPVGDPENLFVSQFVCFLLSFMCLFFLIIGLLDRRK